MRGSLLPAVARRAKVGPALRDPAGQGGRLPDPCRHLRLVELVVLADMEVARTSLSLDSPGGTGRSDAPRKKASLMYFVKQWKPRNQPWPSTP